MFEFREVNAPYPGLRPFEPHESEIFFGRQGHTDRLLEILQRERFLAVIGPSGCGKSSLVRAGLLPGLATGVLGTGSNWRLALLRPGGQPMLALGQALLGRSALGSDLVDEPRLPRDAEDVTADVALVAAELRRGPEGLAGLLQAAAARQTEDSAPFNLLVLVDQFEETFTYAGTDGAEADESEFFVDLLLAARTDASLRVYVVLTMRTDFLGNCVRFLELPEAINRAQYLTPRLSDEELMGAIVGPARVFGGEVKPGLAAALIENTRNDPDQLPILQHALARMWLVAEQINGEHPVIDEECARSAGGVTGALNRHADEVFASLPPDRQCLAEKMFRALTDRRESGQEVRRPQTLKAIADWAGVSAEELKPVIAGYAMPEVSFLHYGRELVEKSVIDLTHEALIRQWVKLRDWVANETQRGEGYRRWAQRAAEYREGVSGLLTGGDLARALDWWNPGADESAWQPNPSWAERYSVLQGDAFADEYEQTRRFIIESRDAEQRTREEEQQRLQQEAEAERQRAEEEQQRLQQEAEAERRRADRERQLADEARASEQRAKRWSMFAAAVALVAICMATAAMLYYYKAQTAEKESNSSLFEAQLTHGSLLARVEDYTEAYRVLARTIPLAPDIPEARRHARNLLAGYVRMMGGRAEQEYTGAGAALTGGVAISPDGKLLAAAGEGGTLVLFDAAGGQLLKRLAGHDPKAGECGGVWSVVFDPQGRWLFSGGEDDRVIRWSLPEGEKLSEWQAPGAVQALALSPDGETLAGGDGNGTITLWSTVNGTPIRSLKGHTRGIAYRSGLAFSPDCDRLASASWDGSVRIWDWRKGESPSPPLWHGFRVHAVVFSPDGSLLATASDGNQVLVWNAESGGFLDILRGHRNLVLGVAFSEDGSQLISASRDNTLRLWDVTSGITRRVYQGHETGILAVTRHGDYLYTASNDTTVRRWTLATPEQWLWETGGSAISAAISPDGRRVAVGMGDGSLRLYSSPSGKELGRINDAHNEVVSRLAFHSDGSQLATSSDDRTAKLWRLDAKDDNITLTVLHTFAGHGNWVNAVTFSPDGRTLATAGYDGQVGLFDVASGQGRLFEAHEGRIASVAFNPRGDRLLSAGIDDYQVSLWNLNDPQRPPQEIAWAQDQLYWASFSPDGREVAAVGREQTVSLYDLANPTAPHRLMGHEDTVYRAIYSPDGRQLATVSADMTVRLWDLDSQRLLFTLCLPTQSQEPTPLWDFDFRCTAAGECWIAVPLTMGRLALYRLPYAHPPASLLFEPGAILAVPGSIMPPPGKPGGE